MFLPAHPLNTTQTSSQPWSVQLTRLTAPTSTNQQQRSHHLHKQTRRSRSPSPHRSLATRLSLPQQTWQPQQQQQPQLAQPQLLQQLPTQHVNNDKQSDPKNSLSLNVSSNCVPSSTALNFTISVGTAFHPTSVGHVYQQLLNKPSHEIVEPALNLEDTLGTLQQQVVEMIRNAWADSTLAQRSNLHQRLRQFCNTNNLNLEDTVDWAIPMFLQSLDVAPSTKLTYSKTLLAIFHQQGIATPIANLFQSGLRVASCTTPTQQATPASPSQINKLLLQAHRSDNLKLLAAIFLAWKTASRWDDVRNIIGTSVVQADQEQIIIEWGTRTKTTRKEPHRASNWTVVHHDQEMTLVARQLRLLQPQEQLIEWTTQQLVQWTHRALQQQDLTAHSFKRGAVDHLMKCAAANQVDVSKIPLLAKHKWQEWLPATTIRYSTDPVAMALALQTQELTWHIPCQIPLARPQQRPPPPPPPPNQLQTQQQRTPLPQQPKQQQTPRQRRKPQQQQDEENPFAHLKCTRAN